jgi:hypothetical protein
MDAGGKEVADEESKSPELSFNGGKIPYPWIPWFKIFIPVERYFPRR